MNEQAKTTKSVYGLLSKEVIRKYDILYSELRPDSVTTFNTKAGKWGAIINDYQLLVEPIYDSTYYDDVHSVLECVNYNKTTNKSKSYTYFNTEAKQLAHFDDVEYIQRGEYGYRYHHKYNSKLWGVIDPDFNVIIEPMYENVSALSQHVFKAQKNGLWGIIDVRNENLFSFQAQEIIGNFDHKVVTVKIEGNYFLLDENISMLEEQTISFLLTPTSNSYWWRAKTNPDKQKFIVDGSTRVETDDFYPFDEITKYAGKWGIRNLAGKYLIPAVHDYIDFFGLSNHYKVFNGELQFTDEHTLLNTKCGVINEVGESVIPPFYEWIDEISEELWAVNSGGTVIYNEEYQEEFWTVKGGKWGVINSSGKLIVPVEYDCIMLNWYRVKDLLIVQNGNEYFDGKNKYDAYDFEGNKMTKRIDYKKHVYSNF